MKYYLILLLILAAAGVIARIISSKWPDIVSYRPLAVQKEKQAAVKKRLLESKLRKNIIQAAGCMLAWFRRGLALCGRLARFGRRLLGVFKNAKPRDGVLSRRKLFEQPSDNLEQKLAQAELLLKRRQFDEAETLLIEVLKTEAKSARAYFGLGKIYTARREWENAEEAFRYIVKLDKKNYAGHRELCNVYRSVKKWNELKALCEELLGLGHEQSWVYANLGTAFKKTGYPEKAEVFFRKAVEIEPQNEALLDLLIEAAIINKNKQLAQKCFNTLTSVSNNQIKLQDYRNKLDII